MGTDPAAAGRTGEGKAVPPGIDTSTAHPARVYDYWLGGKDNFAAAPSSMWCGVARKP